MQATTNRWLLCCAASMFGTACNAEQHSPQTLTFETQSSSEKISDTRSPVDYWVQEYSYPVFSAQSNNTEVAAQLNEAVAALIERYRCSSGGEESFQMDVETLERGLVSLRYAAMWHCSAMPSPDTTEGAINRSLPSLEELSLEAQFVDKRRYSKAKEKVRQLYTTEIAEADEAGSCPSTPEWDYFTVTAKALEFHFNPSEPSAPECRVTVRLSREQLQNALTSESPL